MTASYYLRASLGWTFVLSGGCVFSSPVIANASKPCPKYELLRYDEDWAVLVKETRIDFWTPIKYRPISPYHSGWFSLGGEMRNRVEYWDNFNFNSTYNDMFNLWRIIPHADFHFNGVLARNRQFFRTIIELNV